MLWGAPMLAAAPWLPVRAPFRGASAGLPGRVALGRTARGGVGTVSAPAEESGGWPGTLGAVAVGARPWDDGVMGDGRRFGDGMAAGPDLEGAAEVAVAQAQIGRAHV